MSLLKAWKLRGLVNKFRTAFPDLIVVNDDDGQTVGIKLPESEDGHYLRRIFDAERDGRVGYWEVTDELAADIMAEMMKHRLAHLEAEEDNRLGTIDLQTRGGSG